jgi:hypothetical protein
VAAGLPLSSPHQLNLTRNALLADWRSRLAAELGTICGFPETHRGAIRQAASFRYPRFTSTVFITGRDSCYKFAMAPKSRAEIELAQTLTHYPIGRELLTRIRYGEECFGRRSAMAPCHDCGVTKGHLHIPCCDVEECPNCHTQLLSCDCDLGDACSAD